MAGFMVTVITNPFPSAQRFHSFGSYCNGRLHNRRAHFRLETGALLDQLDALGWVDRVPGPRPSSPPQWIVNPVVIRSLPNGQPVCTENLKPDYSGDEVRQG